MSKDVPVPKGQTLWESRWDKNGMLQSFVTSDAARTKYTFYSMVDGKPVKGATGKSPSVLKTDSKK